MMINLMNDLYAFYVVAESQSLRAAAKTAGISASSMSSRIKRIEGVLGFTLIEVKRGCKAKLTLTEHGTKIHDQLKNSFSEISILRERMCAIQNINRFSLTRLETLSSRSHMHDFENLLPTGTGQDK